MKVAAFRTICWLQSCQKTATLFLPFEYFIAPSISPSGSNEPELSMRDPLRKRSHHWLGIDRITPANRARNTAIVVKSEKNGMYLKKLSFT